MLERDCAELVDMQIVERMGRMGLVVSQMDEHLKTMSNDSDSTARNFGGSTYAYRHI